MTERPILFNGDMVRALLDGSKTMTRRVVKPQPTPYERDGVPERFYTGWEWPYAKGQSMVDVREAACLGPYGRPGDRLIPAMEIPSLGRNYCADTHGRIWSRARDGQTWRILKGSPTSKGYLSVTPAVDGRYKTRLVHRLVAEAYYGYEALGLKQVRHLDSDQLNNEPDNLDWGTQQDNWSDRLVNGVSLGEDHHAAKLTADDAAKIRQSDLAQRTLAAVHDVAQSTIWGIRNHKTWVKNPVATPPNCPRWASRITLEVTEVRAERVQDTSAEDIAAEGVTPVAHGTDPGDAEDALQWAFELLWNSINQKRGFGWDTNPWVWCVTFKRLEASR